MSQRSTPTKHNPIKPKHANHKLTNHKPTESLLKIWLLPVALYAVLGWLVFNDNMPWWVLVIYIVMGAATYWAYAHDKQAARQGEQRIPETVLHLLSIAGGWAMARVAQERLRHKTRKAEFRLTYQLTVMINLALLLGLLWMLN